MLDHKPDHWLDHKPDHWLDYTGKCEGMARREPGVSPA